MESELPHHGPFTGLELLRPLRFGLRLPRLPPWAAEGSVSLGFKVQASVANPKILVPTRLKKKGRVPFIKMLVF